MKEVHIGLIGTGYIGKAYAITYAQAPTVFNLRGEPTRETAAGVNPALAAEHTQAFGFNYSTGDWRVLVVDPTIDVVDICSPNHLHKEVTLEAIRHGKHVYSEKPLALNTHDAREMVDAAKRTEVKTLVGSNYMKDPAARLAKEIIAHGGVGEAIHFYGTHNEDYMADPLSPIRWHCFEETVGLGALGNLAAHIINMTQYLVGEIGQVCGDLRIVMPTRPTKTGSLEMVTVENEDQTRATVRLAGGAQGVIGTSRVVCGRKMGLSYVIAGTRGAINFAQERMAEVKLYLHDDPVDRQGFRTLLVGPAHPDYGAFYMGAGRGIGFNDQKAVEVRDLIGGIATDAPTWPDSEEDWKVSRMLNAIVLSHQRGLWLSVNGIV